MSITRARHGWVRRWKVLHDPQSNRPWIVFRSTEHQNDWTEITRYTTEEEARQYVAAILEHQHNHLEATQ